MQHKNRFTQFTLTFYLQQLLKMASSKYNLTFVLSQFNPFSSFLFVSSPLVLKPNFHIFYVYSQHSCQMFLNFFGRILVLQEITLQLFKLIFSIVSSLPTGSRFIVDFFQLFTQISVSKISFFPRIIYFD